MSANEVFIGAGAIVTMAPECDMFFANCTGGNNAGAIATINASVDDDFELVVDLYVGCTAKLVGTSTQYLMIKSNTANTVIFAENISVDATFDMTILAFGAPCVGPITASSGDATILSDNWLGLVNTFSPPSVEAEMKQMNLAAAGGRNFDYQFKTSETVSGASLDISLNNGSWLYYALGKIGSISQLSGNVSTQALRNSSNANLATHRGFAINTTDTSIARYMETPASNAGTILFPPVSNGSGLGAYNTAQTSSPFAAPSSNWKEWNGKPIVYNFSEANDDSLPSFSLEVLYSKDGRVAASTVDTNNPNVNMLSRIFTGCQVNSMTLTFEEGQELKTSLDLMTRSAFDTPNGYTPTCKKIETGTLADVSSGAGSTGLANYSSNTTDNYPFLFSDGGIKLFGQTISRIKTGSLTISNNITQQRYIGNYNRKVMSAHIPAQRTYELSLTMMITDTQVWDELRNANEVSGSTNQIELNFTKQSPNNLDETINIVLEDYLINGVTIPFPEDKGPLEVEVTATARTLVPGTTTAGTRYQGTWGIVTTGGVASQN